MAQFVFLSWNNGISGRWINRHFAWIGKVTEKKPAETDTGERWNYPNSAHVKNGYIMLKALFHRKG